MIRQIADYLTEEGTPLEKAGIRLSPPLQIVLSSGPAGAERKVVFLVFSAQATEPAIMLKIVRDPECNNRLTEEYDILKSLWQRPALQSSIPQPLDFFCHGEHCVLVEKTVPGVPLNLLHRRRRRLSKQLVSRHLNAAVNWLRRFQATGSTAETTLIGREAILERLACLPDNRLPSSFVAFLLQQADRFCGLNLPLVNAHGDFWPGNILLKEGHNICGVLDWEAFHPARPSFYDLFLFLTTFALGQIWVDKKRAERFRRGFLDDTWLSRLLAGAAASFFESYQLPPAAVPLFYAFFLLEMATPSAAEGLKRREQAGSWRVLLQQYATEPPRFRPFALESIS